MAKPKFQDPNGKHIRVYTSLLNSPAYRVLSFPAKALFIDLRSLVNRTNNGDLSAAIKDMKHKGWTSSATLSKALYELRSMGFIAVTRGGGFSMGTRVCALYRFTDLEVFDIPKKGVQAIKATHDYLRFDSVGAAEVALREGVAALVAAGREKQISPQGRKNVPVQNMNRIGSEYEPIADFIGSGNEQGKGTSVQKMNRGLFQKNGSGNGFAAKP